VYRSTYKHANTHSGKKKWGNRYDFCPPKLNKIGENPSKLAIVNIFFKFTLKQKHACIYPIGSTDS
jgi:hypothetical protein